uniref:Uncharacterized protein n=1 Tax=Tanacetum cinerariifolium TaxID=118510 RepID=A0A6L2JTD9_TANCI|nr:hypothetical protein [Tanacetum cinerariifolium]
MIPIQSASFAYHLMHSQPMYPPNLHSAPFYNQRAQKQMYHPCMASPLYNPPSQYSPIQSFYLDDDLESLWGATSQPYQPFMSQDSKGPSQPVRDDSPVEEAHSKWKAVEMSLYSKSCKLDVDSEDEEVRPMGRDKSNKKASSTAARSESSAGGDQSLVDAAGIGLGDPKDGKRRKNGTMRLTQHRELGTQRITHERQQLEFERERHEWKKRPHFL